MTHLRNRECLSSTATCTSCGRKGSLGLGILRRQCLQAALLPAVTAAAFSTLPIREFDISFPTLTSTDFQRTTSWQPCRHPGDQVTSGACPRSTLRTSRNSRLGRPGMKMKIATEETILEDHEEIPGCAGSPSEQPDHAEAAVASKLLLLEADQTMVTSFVDTISVEPARTLPGTSAIEIQAVTPHVFESPTSGEKTSATFKELVAFTLPLLAIWLSNPIMSLVDTAAVGAQSSVELAALGPGTSLCDNVAYMCSFLAQVTTNLAATALASGDERKADRATLMGMLVAVVVGLGVSRGLLRYGHNLVQLFVGGNAAVSSILPYSCAYVNIRAMGFVAVTVSMVLQGTYLAKKDVATPIKSVVGSSLVNVVLDWVTVSGLGMGIKGAAMSTTIAQWAGLLYLLRKVVPDLRASGALSQVPSKAEFVKFAGLGLPTCLALAGQVATCMAITVAASGCDTVALAAHQVIYGVFLLFCPIGEAVSQTVQTYLPEFTVERPRRANGKARKTLTFRKSAIRMMEVISAVALGLGALNAGVATFLIAGTPMLFTPDHSVWATMRSVSPLCGLSLVLHGVTMALQGAMMATRDVTSMAAVYTVCSAIFCSRFMFMRRSVGTLRLSAVWRVFVIYQVTRFVLFAGNVLLGHRDSFRGLLAQDGHDEDTPSTAAPDVLGLLPDLSASSIPDWTASAEAADSVLTRRFCVCAPEPMHMSGVLGTSRRCAKDGSVAPGVLCVDPTASVPTR